jgi:hypothetical protein
MKEIIRALKFAEIGIYILLGLFVLVWFRKVVIAVNDWRGTYFGLERDNAQRRLSQAVSVLVLLLLVGVLEFFVASFIFPGIPGLEMSSTPTLNPLATATVTLPALALEQTPSSLFPTATLASSLAGQTNGCIPGQVELTSPKNGDQIKKLVELKGTIAVQDFGFYKYEYTNQGSDTWTTIAAGNELKPDGSLGLWDVSLIPTGDYLLRLVVTDNKGEMLPPCILSVKIIAP